MRRRAFGLVLLLLAVPVTIVAQSPAKTYRIGILSVARSPASPNPLAEAFAAGLRDGGYDEGRNLQIERRYAEGRPETLAARAEELVRLRVNAIVTVGTGPTLAARDATSTIPMVFVGVPDPVGLGLVQSYAKPGGNITGLTNIEFETFAAKQLQILKEALPGAMRVAVLVNPTERMHAASLPQARAAAERLGIKLQVVEARVVADLDDAVASAARERADALHVWESPVIFSQPRRIAELALKHKLPSFHFLPQAVEAGGLLGFGPDIVVIWRNAGRFVSRILDGTRPADLPVELPTKYELIVNLATAKALGITIPASILVRADRVIE